MSVARLEAARSARAALEEAVETVRGSDLAASLAIVARKIPVAVSVETVAIRLRDSDGEGHFHVAAVEGSSPSDRLALIFDTQNIAQARSIFVLGHRHSYGRALGVRWLHGEWLKAGRDPLGTITVGSRTERHPTKTELALLARTAKRLGERLYSPDDAPETVRKALRPRELVILTLYVDGLSAQEIADLFVISTHTVRTHIKNAYRRLGVHSREEAEELVRLQRVLELV
jgi:DNA-binding CsgD family transcriptional regulator